MVDSCVQTAALVVPLRLLGVHSKGRAVAQKILEVGGPASAGEVRAISKVSEDGEDELPMGQSCDDTQIPLYVSYPYHDLSSEAQEEVDSHADYDDSSQKVVVPDHVDVVT